MLNGGCHCGAVRYEAAGTPFNETSCHCTICRQTTGAPFVAWFSVRREDFHSRPARRRASIPQRKRLAPSAGVAALSSPSKVEIRAPDEVDIRTASLDEPDAVPPLDHIWTRSKLSWIRLADGLPEYPQSRLSGSS